MAHSRPVGLCLEAAEELQSSHGISCEVRSCVVSLIPFLLLDWNKTEGLFIWAEVASVTEKTFRLVYNRDLALL